MADDTKLFEWFGGLLRQVAPEAADAARKGRRVSRTHTVIDILWTPEAEAEEDARLAAEQAEREAKESAERDAAAAQFAERNAAAAQRAEQLETAAAKLRGLGLTEGEIRAIVGE